jgi:transcriptional regulator CtsR
MKEDITRVLKMVEEGKIDVEKASELIDALKASQPEENKIITTNFNDNGYNGRSKTGEGTMLRVRVLSAANDTVNVQLPIKFIKGVLAACGKIPIDVNGMESLDTAMLLEAMDSGLTGKIVDVKSANGDIVEVTIE